MIHPFILYTLCVIGGAGVCLALPRKGVSPQIFGALLAALAAGIGLLVMAIKAGQHLPNIYFYIFGLISVGAALRVITHPRPVYAALYFILTVVSTAGLFLILSAEFMAFALVIVYAGAILITYLFVIMLATQAPEEGDVEVLLEYDIQAREPMAACVVGFLLLAALTTMLFRGAGTLPAPGAPEGARLLAEMPRKAESVLRSHGLIKGEEKILKDEQTGAYAIDLDRDIITVGTTDGAPREIHQDEWPAALDSPNVERLGFNLLRDHPGTIEIAGVILLMAMLGAVVLSRKQVQIDEEAKLRQAKALAEVAPAGVSESQSPMISGGASGAMGGGGA